MPHDAKAAAVAKIQDEFCNWEIEQIDAIEKLQTLGFTPFQAEELVYSWGENQ